jgi:cytochrome c oxidase subunit 1
VPLPYIPPATRTLRTHHHEESFISKYIFSHDHKMISKQFLVTAIVMAWVAVIMSMMFRLAAGLAG